MSSQLNIKRIAGLTSGVGSHTLTLETGGADRVTVSNTAVTVTGNIVSTGTLTSGGNIVPGTANTYTLGTSSAAFASAYLGSGVYIGGTTSANLLDDYEEGTFTPTITNSSSYSVQQGFYTKIGRICHCQITLQWVQSGTTIGNLGGLPFTVGSSNYPTIVSREWYATGDLWFANLNIGDTGSYGIVYDNNNSTVVNGSTYGLGFTFVYLGS